ATACAGKIQHSGVELHEFDIARISPGAQGHGQAISGANGRIRGQRPQRTNAAGGKHDVIGKPAANATVVEAPHAAHRAIGGGQQVNRAGMGDDVDSAITGCAQESFLNFPPRLVASVDDAAPAVPSLQVQVIGKLGAVGYQAVDGFFCRVHQLGDAGTVAVEATRCHRVLDVQVKRVSRGDD